MLVLGALCGALPLLAVPVSAQNYNSLAPVAIATLEVTTEATETSPAVVTLDGSDSFDPDVGGRIAKYDWEILTEAYQWINLNQQSPQSPTATFEVPVDKLIERFGYSIDFRLTVTDSGRPPATDSDTVELRINQPPRIDIQVTAKLPDPDEESDHDDNGNGMVDENEERYPFEGVVSGPGENGNADNEWHVRASTLLVVDASATSDPDGELTDQSFRWQLVLSRGADAVTRSLPDHTVDGPLLSTDEDPSTPGTEASETVARLPFVEGVGTITHLVYYRLTVTDEDGAAASRIVKIVLSDFHDDPEVDIAHPESDPNASVLADRREGVLAAGENRYVVSLEAAAKGVTLTATGKGDGSARTGALAHTWSGLGVAPSDANRPGAVSRAEFTAPAGTEEGDVFEVQVEVADPDGHRTAAAVELVVADTRAPTATAPEDIDTPDGLDGGYPESDPPTGVVQLRGVGFDPDGDALTYHWEQVRDAAGKELNGSYRGPRLLLVGPDTPVASFRLPEVVKGTMEEVYVQFTVADRWGVVATDVVKITIRDGDDDLKARAGPDQTVPSGRFVRLAGGFSSGLVSSDAIDQVTHLWAYKGIHTHPLTDKRPPLTSSEKDQGFASGQWLPDEEGLYHPTAGGRLKGPGEPFAYFDAPRLTDFNSATLVFELTVSYDPDPDNNDDADVQAHTDAVVITVINRSSAGFFSGAVPGPNYCSNRSLGGFRTYPFDSDGDGVADTCSLNTTRRATVARQNALETLAGLNPEEFDAAVQAVCDAAGFKQADYGDDPGDLVNDACDTGRVSPPPVGVDPAIADVFFSGVVTGPDFCTNFSLGGFRTYPFDSDGDGVADMCSLSTTRREAIARQRALVEEFMESFSAAEQTRHDELDELLDILEIASGNRTQPQIDRLTVLNAEYAEEFDDADSGTAREVDVGDEAEAVGAEIARLAAKNADAIRYATALAAECRAVGTQDFGDDPRSLDLDACVPKPGPTGTPLS